jgi:hypothetical protein
MLTKLAEGEAYSSRPAHSIPVPMSLDPETATLLERLAPGKPARSRFVTWLIHAELARRDERQRLVRMLEVAQDGEEREE